MSFAAAWLLAPATEDPTLPPWQPRCARRSGGLQHLRALRCTAPAQELRSPQSAGDLASGRHVGHVAGHAGQLGALPESTAMAGDQVDSPHESSAPKHLRNPPQSRVDGFIVLG